jgi:parallel beta-helix repeat protein
LFDVGYGEFRYIPGDTAQRTLVARFQGVTKEDKTIYVRTDGNDSNDGSADDSSHALQTVQKAVDIVSKLVIKDDITISLAAGTYSEQVNIGPLMFAGGSLTIVGDPTTPSNVVIDPGTSDFGFYITASILTIRGVKVTGATTLGIKIDNKSSVTLDRVEVVSNDSIGIGVYNQSILTLYGDATTTAKISSNGNRGIYLVNKSIGLIGVSSGKYVEISDNGNRGIWVDNNSWATVYGCQIDGNGSDGIYLAYQSMGRLYGNDTDTSNNNSGYGVKCEYHSKAYVYGDDSLTGSSGDVYPSSGGNLVNNGDTSAVIDVST